MSSFSIGILILFGIRIFRVLNFDMDSLYGESFTKDLLVSVTESHGSFWNQVALAAMEDYLSGDHLIYKWCITIAGIICLLVYLVKGILFIFSSKLFWISILCIGLIILAFLFFIKPRRKNRE